MNKNFYIKRPDPRGRLSFPGQKSRILWIPVGKMWFSAYVLAAKKTEGPMGSRKPEIKVLLSNMPRDCSYHGTDIENFIFLRRTKNRRSENGLNLSILFLFEGGK